MIKFNLKKLTLPAAPEIYLPEQMPLYGFEQLKISFRHIMTPPRFHGIIAIPSTGCWRHKRGNKTWLLFPATRPLTLMALSASGDPHIIVSGKRRIR